MSPAKDDKIQGSRPSPLKIHKLSRSLHKSSSSSTTSSSSSSIAETENPNRNPVIIYTDSPKIIHTEPQDFMALVQKLTGISARKAPGVPKFPPPPPPPASPPRNPFPGFGSCYGHCRDENDSSSVVTTEEMNCVGRETNQNGNGDLGMMTSSLSSSSLDSISPTATMMMNPYCQDLADAPLFTPNYNSCPANFYASPRTFFRYSSEY